jgi:hypothetical protein
MCADKHEELLEVWTQDGRPTGQVEREHPSHPLLTHHHKSADQSLVHRRVCVGQVKTRKVVHEQGLWHKIGTPPPPTWRVPLVVMCSTTVGAAVHVWCVDPASRRVLLQRRAADKCTNPDKCASCPLCPVPTR